VLWIAVALFWKILISSTSSPMSSWLDSLAITLSNYSRIYWFYFIKYSFVDFNSIFSEATLEIFRSCNKMFYYWILSCTSWSLDPRFISNFSKAAERYSDSYKRYSFLSRFSFKSSISSLKIYPISVSFSFLCN